jgi:hypothetical protein
LWRQVTSSEHQRSRQWVVIPRRCDAWSRFLLRFSLKTFNPGAFSFFCFLKLFVTRTNLGQSRKKYR